MRWFLCLISPAPFLCPDLIMADVARSWRQAWPSGHRLCRREACLTVASTASHLSRSGCFVATSGGRRLTSPMSRCMVCWRHARTRFCKVWSCRELYRPG